MRPREAVLDRSGGQCEAMVQVRPFIWTRCGVSPVDVHHLLTRSRGGRILDEIGEICHLMALCRNHHMMADGEEAYEGDLLIDGYVRRKGDRVYYTGTDPELMEKYPNEEDVAGTSDTADGGRPQLMQGPT